MKKRDCGFCSGPVLAVSVALALCGLACAQDPGGPAKAAQQAGKAGAADLIRLAREVEREVEELRGWEFKQPVETDVRSAAELRQFIERELFEKQYGLGRLERTEAFLRMVGLIPKNCDLKETILDVLLNQIGGFYDHESKAFFILDRVAGDYGPLLTRTLIAHELTHALDDQYADLGKLITTNLDEDGAIAVGSVVEGSATVLMMRYMLRAMSSGEYDARELAELQSQEMERSQAFVRAPPYFSTLMANYMCGMYFITRGQPMAAGFEPFEKGVGDNLLAACRAPPTSSEQILHPLKYWDAELRDDPVIVDDQQVEHLVQSPGLTVVHRNTVGELLCGVLAADEQRELNILAAALPSYWTNEAASGWGGDRFYLLAEGADVESAGGGLKGLKGVWVTVWDTPDDRDEFVEAYRIERQLPARSSFRFGKRGAVFLFGFDKQQRGALQSRFEQSPPACTKAGRPWNPDEN